MEVNPHHRFQSAAEVKKALRTALQELGHEIGDPDADEPTTDLDIDKPFNLLVADSVKKRCKALQQYFNRHNFSLSFVTRPASAIERLKGPNPPDGVLFLADTDRELVLEQFPQAQAYGRSLKIPCLAVFAADDEEVVRRTVNSTRFGATMFQPATLRDIRMHFQEVGEQAR
jgi:PleD family two-component response regulator